MITQKYLHELSYKIIGCAIEVHFFSVNLSVLRVSVVKS